MIWSKKLGQCRNFLPYFSKEERMKYAVIATGDALHINYYEGLHDRVLSEDVLLEDPNRHVPEYFEDNNNLQPNNSEVVEVNHLSNDNIENFAMEAEAKLKDTFEYLKGLI